MGCCYSSPHTKRRYRDPGDDDEVLVDDAGNEMLPLRYAIISIALFTQQALKREFPFLLQNRRFGKYRAGAVLCPDDVDGLPSSHIYSHLASLDEETDPVLYDAEIDVGQALRCCRPAYFCFLTPCGLSKYHVAFASLASLVLPHHCQSKHLPERFFFLLPKVIWPQEGK
jgi:hypothetical protein